MVLDQNAKVILTTNNDDIAVGPIGTSLHDPRKIYTKQPINEPYNPN